MDDLKREDGSPISDGINNNTYNLLFMDYYNIPFEEQGNYENFIALQTIKYYTELQEKKIFTKLLKLYSKNKSIDLNKIKFNVDTRQYEYKNGSLIITFDKISNHLKDKELICELTSKKRYHQCHSRAISISPGISGSKIVTGYATIGNQKFLHSIIEYDQDGNTIVLDWTRNLMISKLDYIKLTNFVELSSFEGSKVLGDLEIILGNLTIGLKPYVMFRDELIRDMQRNPHIFMPTEAGRKVIQNRKK